MTDDDAIDLVWLVGCLILVVSALVARRLSSRAWLKLAAVWVAIIGVAWGLVTIAGRFVNLARFT